MDPARSHGRMTTRAHERARREAKRRELDAKRARVYRDMQATRIYLDGLIHRSVQ